MYVISRTYFDECVLFHVMTRRHYFFTKVYCKYSVFFKRYVVARFEISVFTHSNKKDRVFLVTIFYVITTRTLLKPKFQNRTVLNYTS